MFSYGTSCNKIADRTHTMNNSVQRRNELKLSHSISNLNLNLIITVHYKFQKSTLFLMRSVIKSAPLFSLFNFVSYSIQITIFIPSPFPSCFFVVILFQFLESRDAEVVRLFSSHQCGPRWNLANARVWCLFSPCSDCFSPGSPVFLPPQNLTSIPIRLG